MLNFKLNGVEVSVDAPVEAPLLFVLTKCAEKFGWTGYEKKENRGRGISFGRYKNYAALVAVAVEVEVSPRNGRIHVVRAVAANDNGHMIDPDGITNQIEGG